MAHPPSHPRSNAPPWWLEGGTEACPHCGQRYHLEVERRCAACDAPSCPRCHDGKKGPCPACPGEDEA